MSTSVPRKKARANTLSTAQTHHSAGKSNSYSRSFESDSSRKHGSIRVCHGDYVELEDGRLGTVRYVGTPSNQTQVWIGISLSEPSGRHNGTERGIKYWTDKSKHGIFVKPTQIVKIHKSK